MLRNSHSGLPRRISSARLTRRQHQRSMLCAQQPAQMPNAKITAIMINIVRVLAAVENGGVHVVIALAVPRAACRTNTNAVIIFMCANSGRTGREKQPKRRRDGLSQISTDNNLFSGSLTGDVPPGFPLIFSRNRPSVSLFLSLSLSLSLSPPSLVLTQGSSKERQSNSAPTAPYSGSRLKMSHVIWWG